MYGIGQAKIFAPVIIFPVWSKAIIHTHMWGRYPDFEDFKCRIHSRWTIWVWVGVFVFAFFSIILIKRVTLYLLQKGTDIVWVTWVLIYTPSLNLPTGAYPMNYHFCRMEDPSPKHMGATKCLHKSWACPIRKGGYRPRQQTRSYVLLNLQDRTSQDSCIKVSSTNGY